MFRPEIKLKAIDSTNGADLIDDYYKGSICTRLQSKSIGSNRNLNNFEKNPSHQIGKHKINSSNVLHSEHRRSTINDSVKDLNQDSLINPLVTSTRCSTGFTISTMKRIKSHHVNNQPQQLNQLICSLTQIKSSTYNHLSSYLLKSSISCPFKSLYYCSKSFSYLTKATKPNEFTSKGIKNEKFNLSISLASYSIIILLCLIQLLANSPTALAASTAFDYQNNNQPDNSNSIVYQGMFVCVCGYLSFLINSF